MHSRNSSPSGRSTRFVPQVEALEDRCLPSVQIAQSETALAIISDGAGDQIRIDDSGILGIRNVRLFINGSARQLQELPVTEIRILGNGGNDRVTYRLTRTLQSPRTVTVDLGDGVDSFIAEVTQGITGGIAGAVRLNLTADGGNGDDKLRLEVSRGVGVGGLLDARLRGQGGDDVVKSSFVGSLNGQVDIVATGGEEEDLTAFDYRLRPGSRGVLNAQVQGGDGDDRLRLQVTGAAELSRFVAVAQGDEGTDSCARTRNVDSRSCEMGKLLR